MGKNKSRYIRTDLALELREDIPEKNASDGIKISTKINEDSDIKETVIKVTNQKGAELLGKPIGTYVTLESDILRKSDEGIHEPFVTLLHKHLKKMLKDAKRILIVGLGNRAVTPDALGPHVVDNLYITRHLLAEGVIEEAREISAVCPGVMAQTGIEPLQFLRAVCRETKPDIVVAIDALAAREPERLNAAIQICDTGIAPGAGVGNNRKQLNEESLGVKVIAIGVPTVISVPAILHQSVEKMAKLLMKNEKKSASAELSEREKHEVACELLPKSLASMFVTPKDIDESVKRVSFTISEAINRLLVG